MIEGIQFNSLQIHQIENEKIGDQRFMEQFQQITNPLQKFAQEISVISKGLMDLQKDITLRRCVVEWRGIDESNFILRRCLGSIRSAQQTSPTNSKPFYGTILATAN